MEFLLFYIYLIICALIILGFSYLFEKIFKTRLNCIALNIFIGCFFLGSIALVVNFFSPLNKLTNNLIFVIGLVSFFCSINKFREFKNFFFITFLCYITLLLDTTNRPDAGAYHLPYISFLNNSEIILGLANLNTKFGHISFYQYISSVFFNSIFNNKLIFAPIGLMYSSSLVYFFKVSKSKNYSIDIRLVSLFFGTITAIEFNRFSEFGNDETTHIIFFIFIIYIFNLFHSKMSQIDRYFKIVLLFSLYLFLNKTIYAITIFLILFLLNKYRKNIILINKFNFFLFFICICWLFKNIFISGCLIYPVSQTCFENIYWSNNYAAQEATIIEAWSKGYPDLQKKFPNLDSKYSMSFFVSNFNWTSIWFENHFQLVAKKITLFFFIIICMSLFVSKEGEKFIKFEIERYFFVFSLLFLIIWFLKFPDYRLGAGFLIFFISIICLFFIRKFSHKNFEKLLKFTTLILLIGLISKNVNRIYKKFDYKYNDYPYINIYSENKNIKNNYKKKRFRDSEKFFYYIENSTCYYGPGLCTHAKTSHLTYEEKLNYGIIFKKNGGHGKN